MNIKTKEIHQKIIRVTHFLQIAERHISKLYEDELSALIAGTRPKSSQ